MRDGDQAIGSDKTPEAAPVGVTVIIATYDRPDALRHAVESVRLQTFPHWRLLVIGDGCSESTAQTMRAFSDDSRIAYVNLPWRCGEQALPNSAGMSIAETEYIAFLNHDDLWTPEHLEIAVGELERAGADFYLGRAATATVLESGDFPERLRLDYVTPLDRTLREVFWHGFCYVEPASAWVIRRSLAARVGPWPRSVDVDRMPIADWALRAWRAGASLVQHPSVTCLKIEDRRIAASAASRYDRPSEAQGWCLEAMTGAAPTMRLDSMIAGLPGSPSMPLPPRLIDAVPFADERARSLGADLLTPQMAELYFRTGLDSFRWLCHEAGIERGARWRMALRYRTGESLLQDLPDPADVVAYVKSALAANPARDLH